MLIGMLMAVFIVALLFIGPTFENTLTAVAFYGGIIVAMILGWWYSGRLSGGIAGFMLGGSSSGKVRETYSLAEKHEAEQNYKAAIELYVSAIDRDRKNPDPRLKLANLYYRLKDYDNCIKYMQEALAIPRGLPESERCTLLNRIADVYLQHKHDPSAAMATLRQLVSEFPTSKYAVYARERIRQIKKGAQSSGAGP